MEIRRIGVASAATIFGVLNAVMGLIVGASYLLANENGPLAAWIQASSER